MGADDPLPQLQPAAAQGDSASMCGVCKQQPHKYRCPGCQALTCSLPCSKQHKQDTGCSGKRDKLAFVPMQQFTDRHLLSDYHWLEEVSRADDNARRHRPPTPRRELPQHLSSLVHQAKLRGVRLLIMPPGMQRRQTNSTRYDFKQRKLSWRIEWRFPSAAAGAAAAAPAAVAAPAPAVAAAAPAAPAAAVAAAAAAVAAPAAAAAVAAPAAAAAEAAAVPEQLKQDQQQQQQQQGASSQAFLGAAAGPSQTPAAAAVMPPRSSCVITDGRVDEGSLLCDVLGRHLDYQPGSGGQALLLREYRAVGCQDLVVVMRRERCPANAGRYYRIDLQQSLKSQLAGKAVIEYPTLLVLLPGEEAAYNILTPEEQQAELAGFTHMHSGGFRHGQQGLPPPPPPPPPPPRVPPGKPQQQQTVEQSQQQQQQAGQQQQQQAGQQEEQQQQQQPPSGADGEPPAKRRCNGTGASAALEAAATSTGTADPALAGPAAAQLGSPAAKQQQQQSPGEQQQQQPKYYYYDPNVPDDDDEDADLLAGLEDDDEAEAAAGSSKAAAGNVGQAAAAAAVGAVVGSGEGAAVMMELLGQYDENEIDIDVT